MLLVGKIAKLCALFPHIKICFNLDRSLKYGKNIAEKSINSPLLSNQEGYSQSSLTLRFVVNYYI
jgi:hypothetical protein